MDISRLIKSPHEFLGRIELIRKGHSRFQAARQHFGTRNGATAADLGDETLFPDLLAERCVDELREDGLTLGLRLPSAIVDEIRQFSEANPLRKLDNGQPTFFQRHEVVDGRLPDGREMIRGNTPKPFRCPAVERIALDPLLNDVARRYLGYWPRTRVPKLWWIFANDFPSELNWKIGIANHYHYDLHSYNSLVAGFYLTDADRTSGARVVLKKSHAKKPMRMLIGSKSYPEDQLLALYGQDSKVVIEGPAGTGFLQDAFGYHKVLEPRSADRLALEIIFS